MAHLTHSTKPIKAKSIERQWHLIDAKKQIVGRLASKVAQLLIGKHKINYSTHLDMGDYVVVINARDMVVTGNKEEMKTYSSYSGYPGGLKTLTYAQLKEKKPSEILRRAVMGMLPKNKLRDRAIVRFYVYQDDAHPHGDKFSKHKTN